MNANVGTFLHRWANEDPDRAAIIDTGRGGLQVSYASLDAQASMVAGALVARGLEPGDRVAICMDNGLEFASAWFGCVYAGCTTLPIPAMATAREIAFRLRHANCHALLCDESHEAIAAEAKALAQTATVVLAAAEAAHAAHGHAGPVICDPDAIAMILYTSGTTGSAKGVCVNHRSLASHTDALVHHTLCLTSRDRILGVLPLTHSYGIRMTLLVPFYAGASTVFAPRFSAERALELCSEHRVTWLPGVPTMFVAWANMTQGKAPPSLRWCMSSGAPLVEGARLRAESRLGAPVRQGYGLTEATFSTINAPPDKASPGSVGAPVHGVELRIETQAGIVAMAGERGEVLVRGPNVMAGYLGDEEATAAVVHDGWVHTGDIGYLDDEGRLTVVDRRKDIILRGGHSVYPFEVEDALALHPAVADVAVVGKPDDYYGEEIVGIIVARTPLSAQELDAWVREHLSPIKVPRAYAFIDALPLGPSGKTLKRALRAQVAEGEIPLRLVADDAPAQ
ncbi:MAG: AMP-binding protein [Myxococcota bacterium]